MEKKTKSWKEYFETKKRNAQNARAASWGSHIVNYAAFSYAQRQETIGLVIISLFGSALVACLYFGAGFVTAAVACHG